MYDIKWFICKPNWKYIVEIYVGNIFIKYEFECNIFSHFHLLIYKPSSLGYTVNKPHAILKRLTTYNYENK